MLKRGINQHGFELAVSLANRVEPDSNEISEVLPDKSSSTTPPRSIEHERILLIDGEHSYLRSVVVSNFELSCAHICYNRAQPSDWTRVLKPW